MELAFGVVGAQQGLPLYTDNALWLNFLSYNADLCNQALARTRQSIAVHFLPIAGLLTKNGALQCCRQIRFDHFQQFVPTMN